MRCLLVEDEQSRIDAVMPKLLECFGNGQVALAKDRDSAIQAVRRTPFDVVVLDQRIPTAPDQLNPNVVHGRSVLEEIVNSSPYTVVLYLTGLPMEDEYVDNLIKSGNRSDVWGDGQAVPLLERFSKNNLGPFFSRIEKLAETIASTHAIEINTKGHNLSVSEAEARMLRTFARMHGGSSIDLEPINGGRSGALTLRNNVRDAAGHDRIRTIAKLGSSAAIDQEVIRFSTEVQRLAAGSYAPLITPNVVPVLGKSAAFYRLADGYDKSLFAVLNESDNRAAACVDQLRQNFQPWVNTKSARRVRIADLVELVIWSDRLPALHTLLDGVDWQVIEDAEINVNFCAAHGDLHGGNVLVDAYSRAMMIDYGAVEELPSAYDAVTVELSPFFHPDGNRELLGWRAGDAEIDWFDRQAFAGLVSVPYYVGAARSWAHSVAYSDREVLACGYAYMLRQLQFSGGDRKLALSMIRGVVEKLKSLV